MEESESTRVAEEGIETKLSRKEKKKMAKKKKRKEKRKEMAAKERLEEEVKSKDPQEQRKLDMMIKEEEEMRERVLKEFEERERIWIREMELKKKKEQEEEEEKERRKVLEEREKEEAAKKQLQVEKENECNEDDDWEYVEEGPAEIIWQGNEIIIRKKKVRVPKKDANQLSGKEDVDRPTSNPFPPKSESFADQQNAQQALETVAQQVPHFGTEQDKAHCPFHLKTGACRFGQRCSRVHFYPDKSSTLLIKNMYNGPGLAWEQDEGLEIYGFTSMEILGVDLDWVGGKAMSYSFLGQIYISRVVGAILIMVITLEGFGLFAAIPIYWQYTDEEVERSYEEFYEDVHTEFLKFGELVNFKVCRNGSSHLRGNVYVHYKSLESAVLAYRSANGRYFAGKQVTCEFINVTRWKVAICGEYMKSRLKTCSRGMACNFIHCFRNPGGDYEWADWDKPPPRYWVKKMAALFGHSDESGSWKQMEQDHTGQTRKMDATNDSHRFRRSRSREVDCVRSGSARIYDEEHQVRERTHDHRGTNDNRKQIKIDEKLRGESREFKDNYCGEGRSDETNSDGSWSDRDRYKDGYRHRRLVKYRSSLSEKSTDYRDAEDRTQKADSSGDCCDRERDVETHRVLTRKSSRYINNTTHMSDRDWQDWDRDRERDNSHLGKRSKVVSRVGYLDNHGNNSIEYDSGSNRDLSDGGISSDRYQSRKKRRSGDQRKVSKYLYEDGVGKHRSYYTDSSDDWFLRDKERRHSHKRKHLRHQTEELEFSDDQGEPMKKSKKNCHRQESDPIRSMTHKHSSRRSHLRKDKSRADHCSSISGRSYEICRSIDEQDRWRPIDDTISVQSYKSDSPGRYSGRSKSPDFDSKYYNSENIDDDCWESKDD